MYSLNMRIEKSEQYSYNPFIRVVDDNGEEIIRYTYELFQDIKFGDWTGMFSHDGKPDKVLTDDDVWEVIDSLYNEKQSYHSDEEIEKQRKAWELLGPIVKSNNANMSDTDRSDTRNVE